MVFLKLPNSLEYQELSRQIRDLNKSQQNDVTISFSEDLKKIVVEGETIFLPDDSALDEQAECSGEIKSRDQLVKIVPEDRGKTVNLHLDFHLAKELEEIRKHVSSKTQQDILLDIFKKGIQQYKNGKS